MPDPLALDKERDAINKRRMMGQVIAFLARTARDFATRQVCAVGTNAFPARRKPTTTVGRAPTMFQDEKKYLCGD